MSLTAMKTIGILLVVQVFLSIPALAGASELFEYLGAGELKQMMDQKAPGLVVIDSRSVNQYGEGHIKGALNIPLVEMERDATLPHVPKDSWLVFYCSGTT